MNTIQGARLCGRVFQFLLVLTLPALSPAQSQQPAAPAIPAEAAEIPAGTASLHKIELIKKIIPKYGRMEVRAEIESLGLNPYDPDEIRVDLLLKSPSGARKTAPGFFFAAKSGQALGDDWRVRFSPDEEGEWNAELVMTTSDGSRDSQSFEFECNTPSLPAPVRVSREHPQYFETADGKFFYPLGQNVCWGTLKEYEHHFSKMHQNGENWSRIWIAPWNVDIEWSNAKPGFRGLGIYHLDNAAKLDRIMEMADTYGIHLQMVLHEHCRIATQWNPEWKNNPYNKERGGPCEKPQDFFTNPEAQRLTRNRIRYIIARWGYSSRVMAWELFNEVNLGDDFNPATDTAWHREMARFIRKTDPQGRMITTSYAGELNDEVFALPEIDFAQVHVYDESIVEKLIEWMTVFSEYKKPYFVGEFGRNTQDGVDKKDKKGMVLHSGIWAQFMMPSGGNAMSWWWYDLIKPSNLYYRFGTLNAFAGGVDRRKGKWNWQYGGLTKDPNSPRVLSMASARTVMFWMYDPKILPYVEKLPESMPEIEGEIVIENLSAGKWSVEKWEPFNSHVPTRGTPATDQAAVDGKMTIKIKASGPDCAYKLELPDKERTDENRLPSLKLEPWEGGVREAAPRAKLSIRKSAAVTVDGDGSDWASEGFTSVEPKDGSKPGDRSFRFAVVHDDTNLYVLCEVKDDELVRENKGDSLWKDDCVELWLDVHREATKFKNMPNHPGLYQINLAPASTPEGAVDVVIYRNPGATEALRKSIRAVSKKSADGYVMEVAIPLAVLRGADHALKREMGFNISIGDSDKHGKQKGSWSHLVWQGQKEEDATQWSEAILEP